MSQIQFQDGMALSQFLEIYNGEVQYEAPLEQARKSEGIDCLRYRFLVFYNPSISLHSTEPESPDLRNRPEMRNALLFSTVTSKVIEK